jgi:hypothetical protein
MTGGVALVARFAGVYSRGMMRALLIALLLASSCKKEPLKGDLPPASDWQGSAHPSKSAENPHGAAPANPHADNPHADNPHADNPHGDNPHAGAAGPHFGSVPEQVPPRTLDKLPDGRLALGPFTLVAPSAWTVKPITSNMRAADFMLPAKQGGDAELIVYYFGKNGAGSVEDNVNRWVDQFEQPSGKPSREVAKIEKTKFAGQDATYISLAGRFVGQAMPGVAQPADKADQALLAAIIDSPTGPYYFKLVGAKPTVDAGAKAFRAMLDSLKVR